MYKRQRIDRARLNFVLVVNEEIRFVAAVVNVGYFQWAANISAEADVYKRQTLLATLADITIPALAEITPYVTNAPKLLDTRIRTLPAKELRAWHR